MGLCKLGTAARVLRFFILYSCVTSCIKYAQAEEGQEGAQDLDASSFQSKVLDTTDFWMVGYYDSKKGGSFDFTDTIVQKLANYGVSLGKVDCAKQSKACKTAMITHSPAVQLMLEKPQRNPYTNKLFRNPMFYSGEISDRDIERFLSKAMPSSLVTKVDNVKALDEFVKTGESAGLPTALLFSEKTTIPLIFRSLAAYYKNRINFAFVSAKSDSEVASRYGITSASVGLLTSSKAEMVKYDGDDLTSRPALVEFFAKYAAEEAANSDNSDGSSAQSSEGANSAAAGQSAVTTMEALNLGFSTLSTDTAWLITVAQSDDALPETHKDIVAGCVGHIKCAVVTCGEGAAMGTDFGSQLCTGTGRSLPFLFGLKHGSSARDKLSKGTPEKWSSLIYDPADHKKAIKTLGDSLPDTGVSVVSEFALGQFVVNGAQKGKISYVLMSNSQDPPGLFKNVALQFQDIAQFGFLSEPSMDMLRNMGDQKLPVIVAIPPPKPDDPQGGMQLLRYDSKNMGGPVSFNTLSMFVKGVYDGVKVLLEPYLDEAELQRRREERAGGKKTQPEPAPEPESVDEGPIVEETEESKAEAEEFLKEIQREEEERQKKVLEEMKREEEEKKRLKEEEEAAKKKKKKSKKSKKKKAKSAAASEL